MGTTHQVENCTAYKIAPLMRRRANKAMAVQQVALALFFPHWWLCSYNSTRRTHKGGREEPLCIRVTVWHEERVGLNTHDGFAYAMPLTFLLVNVFTQVVLQASSSL